MKAIKIENSKARKERAFLMDELNTNERRGSIFIDKVNKVVAAV